MESDALVLRSRQVLVAGDLRPAAVHVADGRIAAVTNYDDLGAARDMEVVDLGQDALLPGFIDTHVHVNEPGRTAWEGFATATRAAAAAGITTIIDMPLNCVPPTTSVRALRCKQEAAQKQCNVDVGFWGGLVPDNHDELGKLVEAGVFGFKAFMVDPGVEEFVAVDTGSLADGMRVLAQLDALTIVHAEDPDVIARSSDAGAGLGHHTYRSWLASRPPAAEIEAVAGLARLSRELMARTHVLHVSSADVVPILRAAQQQGTPITAETCPHYLTFTAEDIPDGGTTFKCAPPIREAGNRDRLWRGLEEGVVSMVVSDHSPSPPELKHLEQGDFFRAWGGISSLQLGPSAVWTQAVRRGYSLAHLSRWMSTEPAALVGLSRKGRIAVGYDADFAIFDPGATFDVVPTRLEHRHAITPYAGYTLRGVVKATYVRGQCVFADGQHRPGLGHLLQKESA